LLINEIKKTQKREKERKSQGERAGKDLRGGGRISGRAEEL
jgi:hypothetical protein